MICAVLSSLEIELHRNATKTFIYMSVLNSFKGNFLAEGEILSSWNDVFEFFRGIIIFQKVIRSVEIKNMYVID